MITGLRQIFNEEKGRVFLEKYDAHRKVVETLARRNEEDAYEVGVAVHTDYRDIVATGRIALIAASCIGMTLNLAQIRRRIGLACWILGYIALILTVIAFQG